MCSKLSNKFEHTQLHNPIPNYDQTQKNKMGIMKNNLLEHNCCHGHFSWVEEDLDVHKLFVYKQLTHQNPKVSHLMNT